MSSTISSEQIEAQIKEFQEKRKEWMNKAEEATINIHRVEAAIATLQNLLKTEEEPEVTEACEVQPV